jgi:prophage regulatory protein
MRFIRKKELRVKVGFSPAHIDRLEKAGAFPKRIALGENSVAWLEHEVEAWIEARVAERDAA